MTARAAGPIAPSLHPVPGAEQLRWAGPPLRLDFDWRCNALPVVVATGGADAALVDLEHVEHRREVLVSRRLDGAFGIWPPTPGAPVVHTALEHGKVRPRIAAWHEGMFLMTSHGGMIGRWDAPGTPRPLDGYAMPDGGVYATRIEGGEHVVEHVAGDDLDRVTPVGRQPIGDGVTHADVTASGVLWLARVEVRPEDEDELPVPHRVDLLRGVPGELRRCGSFACPAGSAVRRVVGRASGGAWVVMRGTSGLHVLGIDADGQPADAPWELPFWRQLRGSFEVAPWGDGFAVLLLAHVPVLVLSDGIHTTRVADRPRGEELVGQQPSIVSGPGGRSILVAYQTTSGVEVARADVAATSGDDAGAVTDPWTWERGAARWLAEREALEGPRPAKGPRPPGQPVGERDPSAATLPSRERIVRFARVRAVLDAIEALHGTGSVSGIAGDAVTGSYGALNGGGDHIVVAWDPEGVVAVVFDHDLDDERGVRPSRWKPARHLGRVPDALAHTLERAITFARRKVTGGLWVTSGPEARHAEAGFGTEALIPLTRRAEDLVSAGNEPMSWIDAVAASPAQAELALRLADATASGARCTLTPEEGDLLLTPPRSREGVAVDPAAVERAVAALEPMGIDWPGAVERARALANAER